MQQLIDPLLAKNQDWQQLCKKLESTVSLSAVVLTAWQMGLLVAKAIVEQHLAERAQLPIQWKGCSVCGTHLHSKGFVKRQMLTLVGLVEWKRRVGRCPRQCLGSQYIPFDDVLGIQAYQQTSTELIRLGCLLGVFLPFNIAAQLLLQRFTGIAISDITVWQWVQGTGQRAMETLTVQLQQLSEGHSPESEPLNQALAAMPLILAAD